MTRPIIIGIKSFKILSNYCLFPRKPPSATENAWLDVFPEFQDKPMISIAYAYIRVIEYLVELGFQNNTNSSERI